MYMVKCSRCNWKAVFAHFSDERCLHNYLINAWCLHVYLKVFVDLFDAVIIFNRRN